MSAQDVGAVDEYVSGEARQVRIGPRTLVIVRIEDDFYVLDDRCSHEDYSLAQGEVDATDATIECARHGAIFDLRDGTPQSFPATRPVARYDVVVRDGRVEVTFP